MKKELENCFDFSVRRAFKAIDEHRFRYITDASIRNFLRKMGHQVLKPEIIAILRRFDLDGDSKLSFKEFSQGIKSISPSMVPSREPQLFVKAGTPNRERNAPLRERSGEKVKRSKSAGSRKKRIHANRTTENIQTESQPDSSFMH